VTGIEGAAGAEVVLVFPGMIGLPTLEVAMATMSKDDDAHALSIRGATTVPGEAAELLVGARWDNADTDTEPELAFVVRFESIGLGGLNASWTAFPVQLAPALVGVANTTQTLSAENVPGAEVFFDDGLQGTDNAFTVEEAGVILLARVDGGTLWDGASAIGAVEGLRLRGTLAASVSILGGSGPSADASIMLAADVALSTPDDVATAGVEFDSPWTLTIEAESSAQVEATFGGGASVDLGEGPMAFTAEVSIAYDDPMTTLTLTGVVGEVQNLFGQSWLDLDELTVTISIEHDASDSSTTFAVLVSADMTIGPVSATASIAIDVAPSGRVTVALDLSTTEEVALGSVLSDLGAPSSLPNELTQITITNFGLHVSVAAGGGEGVDLTASVMGGATILARGACGDGSPEFTGANAQLLFRLASAGGGSPDVLIGAGLSGLTLRQLSCDVPLYWTLPDLSLLVATAEIDEEWDDVDGPTQSFFCASGEDYRQPP
jgi:hypothetical protein